MKLLYPFIILFTFSLAEEKFQRINESIVDSDLWSVMEQKFTIDLARDFSNQDLDAWLKYFAPNKKINVYQYGEDVSGKRGQGKTIKVYSGNIFSSLIRGRISTRIMAKIIFKRLKKQNYKKSNIELLGISIENDKLMAYVRFERINKSGIVYESARGLYTLIQIDKDWYITEISTYDDKDEINQLVGYTSMLKRSAINIEN